MGVAARLAVAHLERKGKDPNSWLAQCGLSPRDLARDTRVNAVSQIQFLELVSHATKDEWLGLTLASDFDLREAGLLYYVAASSRRLGDAFARLQRYCRIGNEAVAARIERGDYCRISVSFSGVPRHRDRHFIEFMTLVILRLSRHLVGRELKPRAVSFVHHRSGDVRKAERMMGCDVQFGTDADAISFDTASMELPLMTEDPFLNEMMVKMCEDALAARASNISPFRTLVENTIAPLLPHAEADARIVAGKLGLSERTFSRRLAAEDLSFGSILDELRRDLAMQYLGQNLQASQIAWLLGFRQLSSFSHACRRWTGKSPSQHRRQTASA